MGIFADSERGEGVTEKLQVQFADLQADFDRFRVSVEDYIPKTAHARVKKELSDQAAELSQARRETERAKARADGIERSLMRRIGRP